MCIGYNLNMNNQRQHLIDHNYIQRDKEEINVSNLIIDHDYALPVITPVPCIEEDVKDIKDKPEEATMQVPHIGEDVKDKPEEATMPVPHIGEDVKDKPEEAIVDIPTIYTILPGIQRNTKIYVDNLGYKYYKKKNHINTITLICDRQRNPSKPICYGIASISIDATDNRISIRTPHNHEPTVFDLNVPILRYALTERGLDPNITTRSVRSIYNTEIIWHREAAQNYTYTQTKARVRRMRRLRKLQC
ncbi:hypothetical protein AGLY_005407 [Aphis glycines]|uniref:FLYWCH-type domain-containing protein n=1 Tax=Aphis glycines TaxID=307491 RepID=A0A6G0TTW0_APHGL|nr:hypothetical protein AGLY_005407 [Aphis glycines]